MTASLGLAFFALFWAFSGRFRLLDADELTHARVALEAARHGHWFPLWLDQAPWPEKPPLLPWLAGLAFLVAGPTEMAARFWPACFGALALVQAWRLSRRWGLGPVQALAPVLALAFSGDWLYHARFLSMDTALLACGLSAALAWEEEAPWRAGLWLALAAAFKSWFALAWAAVFVLDALLPRAGRGEAGRRRLAPLLFPPLAVLGVWLAASAWSWGPGFVEREWSHDLWGRVTGQGHPEVAPPARLYLAWARVFFPLGLAAAAAMAGRSWRLLRDPEGSGPRWAWLFLLAWGAGLLAVRVAVFHYFLPWGTLAVLLWVPLLIHRRTALQAAWALSLLALLWIGPDRTMGHGWIGLALLPAIYAGAAQRQDSAREGRLVLGLAGLLLVLPFGWHAWIQPQDPNGPLVAALLRAPEADLADLKIRGRQTQAPLFYKGISALFFDPQGPLPPGRSLNAADGLWNQN